MDLLSLKRVVSAARALQTPSIDNDVVQVQPRSNPGGRHPSQALPQTADKFTGNSDITCLSASDALRGPDEFSISRHQCFALSAFSASAIKFLML